jgi:monoamine oxidase
VLKARAGERGTIRFTPALSEKFRALDKIEMGAVVKITAVFDAEVAAKLEGREKLSFIHLGSKDPFQVAWSMAPIEVPMFTFWAGGSAALKLKKQSRTRQVSRALTLLARALHLPTRFLRAHLLHAYAHDWNRDPFARGAYAYLGVDGKRAQSRMVQPEQNTLFFAGEALNVGGEFGTVDAAIASGCTAARRISR